MFAVFNAAFIPVVYFFYPETALKPLETIDNIFTSPDKNKIGSGIDILDREADRERHNPPPQEIISGSEEKSSQVSVEPASRKA